MRQAHLNSAEKDIDPFGPGTKLTTTQSGFPLKIVSSQLSHHPAPLRSRFASLNVLALALLSQIETLEEHCEDDATARLNLQQHVQEFEIALIRTALLRTRGRQREAARLLGVKASTLNAKIKRLKIELQASTDHDETSDIQSK